MRCFVILTFYFEIIIDPLAVMGKIQTSQKWHLVASVTSWTSADMLACAEVTTSVLGTFLLPPAPWGYRAPVTAWPAAPDSQGTVQREH